VSNARSFVRVTSLLALLGCGGGEATASLPTPAPAEAQPPSAPAEVPQELTDEQILQITHTANLGEIAQAKLAQSKTTDPRVRKLAAMMLEDHTAADTKGMAIARKESLTPAPSATSTSIDSDVESATSTLQSENGAKDADVKAFLAEVRPKIAMHLQHAQDLQNAMQK